MKTNVFVSNTVPSDQEPLLAPPSTFDSIPTARFSAQDGALGRGAQKSSVKAFGAPDTEALSMPSSFDERDSD